MNGHNEQNEYYFPSEEEFLAAEEAERKQWQIWQQQEDELRPIEKPSDVPMILFFLILIFLAVVLIYSDVIFGIRIA